MGREEGTVSYPRSSSSSSSPAVASDNKCYTEWDFCSAGSEAENAYFWKLGWCAAAEERGAMSLGQCMTGEESMEGPQAPTIRTNPIIRTTRAAPRPEVSPDLPWGRAYCLMTYPSNLEYQGATTYICGWDATLPPGMVCKRRNAAPPWDCTGGHALAVHVTQTKSAEATGTAGG